MRKTAFVVDDRYIDHDASPNHPERPARIQTLIDLMETYDREGMRRIEPRPATEAEILTNHSKDLFDAVAATSGQDITSFDSDTAASVNTFGTALLASGGLMAAVDEVMAGRADNAFAMVRPPGHHAEPDRAMGFCFFNNVAIAARYLRAVHGVERVLVVDWDVHHGNGTQASFYDSGDVLFVSSHQWPLYPGSGAGDETGEGEGAGYTVNIPLPAGCGDAEHVAAYQRLVDPIARQFDPQFVLVSAGYDSHHRDPLGGMEVSGDGFAALTSIVLAIADAHADGRLAVALEGGYSLRGLQEGVRRTLDVLGEGPTELAPQSSSSVAGIIDKLREVHAAKWDL